MELDLTKKTKPNEPYYRKIVLTTPNNLLYLNREQGTDFLLPKWAFSRRQETSVSCSYAERSPFYLEEKMPTGVYIRTKKIRKNIGLASQGRIPWSKGKHIWKDKKPPMLGKHHIKETIKKMIINSAMKNKKGKNHPAWEGGQYLNCKFCGKSYYRNPSKLKNSKFCSNKCSAQFRYQGRIIEKICKICNKKFISYIKANRKFCSMKCFNKSGNFSYPKRKGKNHWNWQGGITSLIQQIRHLLEYKQWIKSIFKRDNYTCQECFSKGKKLHAHHKNKTFSQLLKEFLQQYSQFSPIEDKETLTRLAITYEPFWDINNGITLCKSCHKLTNSYCKKYNFLRA